MELKVEGRNIEIKPSWREEIDDRTEDLRGIHPELTHVRVQLTRNTRHHKGQIFEALVVANFPKRHTATARKDGETPEGALRAAFGAMETELKKFRDKRASIDHSTDATG